MIKIVNVNIKTDKNKSKYNFNDCYFFDDKIVHQNLNIRKLL